MPNYSLNNILNAVGEVAYNNNLPFIFFRLPNSKIVHSMIGYPAEYHTHINLNNNSQGFVFADFIREKCLLINELVSFKDLQLQSHPNPSKQQIRLAEQIVNYLKETSPSSLTYYQGRDVSVEQDELDNYQTLVARALDSIKRGYLGKVVLATRKLRPLDSQVDVAALFLKLLRYERAFISLVSVPNVGTWMGATPEVLLKKRADHLETVALAGTKRQSELDSQTWSPKEIREHDFVVKDITDCFKNVKLDYNIAASENLEIGSLVHIKKHITATTTAPWQATQILKSLHPTSAVCGTSKQAALSFILRNERFSRDFYAGYLGFWDKENCDLFVNLRCARLFNSKIILYSGAGITRESIPAQEQAEINAKFSILESVLD